MAKKPIRVFRRTDGRIAGEVPVQSSQNRTEPQPVPVYSDGIDGDRSSITQQVHDMPEIYRARTGESAHSQYDELLHCIYDAVMITEMDGSIVEVNARAEHNFIWTKEDLCKMNILDIISGADEQLLDLVRKNVTDQKFTVLEAVCLVGDGSRFSSEIVVNKMRLGRPSLCFFIRDVTRRKQAEEDLRVANERLVEAEKIQARVDTLSTIFYDLNNPLQILTCMAEIDKNEEYKKQLERVVSVLDKLRKQESLEAVRADDGSIRYDISTGTKLQPCDSKRLMVVDDEKLLRDMFVNALSLTIPGVSIESASNGQDAVKIFCQKRPAVIVMDVSMPIMNGEAAFMEIKAECERQGWRLPAVIFCTGFVVSESLSEIVGDGSMHTYLEKPLTMANLIGAVKSRLMPAESSSAP
ncbi:MAG: response regulator [Kiritimatiellae bacterium]|nr:response regulator [Kiritimatiellia bacterium]MDD5520906.1 response regulator [Kiritimatiellia bacterium]